MVRFDESDTYAVSIRYISRNVHRQRVYLTGVYFKHVDNKVRSSLRAIDGSTIPSAAGRYVAMCIKEYIKWIHVKKYTFIPGKKEGRKEVYYTAWSKY